MNLVRRTLLGNRSLLRVAIRAKHGSRIIDKTIFANMISRGDVIMDVGANVGELTTLFSHLAGKDGAVHSFEPVQETFKMLQARAEADCLRNVTLVNCALGASVSEGTIYQPGTDHGQSSFAHHDSGSWSTVTPGQVKANPVRIETLDSYIERANIQRIDFLKIDVEGYELMCLRGATKAISMWKPVIYLEVNPQWSVDFGYRPIDVANFLREIGYSEIHLFFEGRLSRLTDPAVMLGHHSLNGSGDLLCVGDTSRRSVSL